MSPISSRFAVGLATLNLAHAWISHKPLHQIRHVAYRAQSTIPSSTFAFQAKENIQQSKRYLFGGLFSSNTEFAAKDEILDAMDETNTIVLDVRSMDEINANGKVKTNLKWFQSNCTPTSCPDLVSQAKKDFPDKDATIVIHCASGKRAFKAQEILESEGYRNVLNAGTYANMKEILGQ